MLTHSTIGLAELTLADPFSGELAAQKAETDGEKMLRGYGAGAVGGVWEAEHQTKGVLQHRYQWILNKRFLQLATKEGDEEGVSIIGIDPTTDACTWWRFSDRGEVGKCVLSQVGDGVWFVKCADDGPGSETIECRLRKTSPCQVIQEKTRRGCEGVTEELPDLIWNHRMECPDAAAAARSSRRDFKELCGLIEGRWVSDVTWVEDRQGVKRDGNKATCYFEATMSQDGNAMTTVWYGGAGSGTGICHYDSGNKQIKRLSIASNGVCECALMHKREDGCWVESLCGSLADGTKFDFTGVLTVTDSGDIHTCTGSGTVGDKNTVKRHDVWRRAGNGD